MSDLVIQTLAAGASLQLRREAGLFLLNEASAPVRVKISRRGTVIFDASGIGRGVKVRPEGGLDQVDVVNESGAAVDIECFVCAGDVDVQIATGIQVTVDNSTANAVPVASATPLEVTNPAGQRLNVNVDGGTVNVTATAVEINNSDANPVPMSQVAGESFQVTPYQATAVTNGAAVAVTDTQVAVVALDGARRGVRIKNAGGNPVAIGGTGIAFATAAVVLQAGETWNENEAPGAAWFAICGAGLSSTLHIQTVA